MTSRNRGEAADWIYLKEMYNEMKRLKYLQKFYKINSQRV